MCVVDETKRSIAVYDTLRMYRQRAEWMVITWNIHNIRHNWPKQIERASVINERLLIGPTIY